MKALVHALVNCAGDCVPGCGRGRGTMSIVAALVIVFLMTILVAGFVQVLLWRVRRFEARQADSREVQP